MPTMATFPEILFNLLESNEYPQALGWGLNGTTIWIAAHEFNRGIMEKHFPGITKYASFSRKMHRYGFKKVRSIDVIPQPGVTLYFNLLFRKDSTFRELRSIRITCTPEDSVARAVRRANPSLGTSGPVYVPAPPLEGHSPPSVRSGDEVEARAASIAEQLAYHKRQQKILEEQQAALRASQDPRQESIGTRCQRPGEVVDVVKSSSHLVHPKVAAPFPSYDGLGPLLLQGGRPLVTPTMPMPLSNRNSYMHTSSPLNHQSFLQLPSSQIPLRWFQPPSTAHVTTIPMLGTRTVFLPGTLPN